MRRKAMLKKQPMNLKTAQRNGNGDVTASPATPATRGACDATGHSPVRAAYEVIFIVNSPVNAGNEAGLRDPGRRTQMVRQTNRQRRFRTGESPHL
ncbi:hypothetical protein BDV29DRAFT_176857 [Aspergillus leporis]|uniref:Uncharacterized protein n=1 Tax=Aspergillus leporis TaxID=41062 RepID=A0A5N5WVW6_9EURO|nr:hypothetical protein BDV29DRAFT_176857 [Aspergillus leporis]